MLSEAHNTYYLELTSDSSARGENMLLLSPNKHNRQYPDEESRDIMLKTIRKPHFDKERFGTVWKEVYSLNDLYEMRK